jgi:hypothetical protein
LIQTFYLSGHKRKGYAGFIIKDVLEGLGTGGKANDIIVFSPNQIKSAAGNAGDSINVNCIPIVIK